MIRAWSLALSLGAACGSANGATLANCDPHTTSGPCTCELHALKPLQGAIGMGEVRDKAEKIAKKTQKERKDLEDDPIKVVRGPEGNLFVTDHHHGARAWLLAGFTTGICSFGDKAYSTDPAQFWKEINEDRLVHLADKDGKRVTPDALPQTLEALPDDPYRTLAWMLRKKDGFCRSLMPQKEFAEFIWADWMRRQPELPAAKVVANPKSMLPEALKLAESTAAADLPGYRGNKPPNFTCPE